MKHKAVEEWYRTCVHFSDAVIINRRWDVPGQWVTKFLEPYEKEFYPCLFFNLTKIGAIANPPAVIDGEPLRLSHIFDDIDAVDEMEFDEDNLPDEPFDLVRQVDKYFARDELGRRNILVPEIGDLLKAMMKMQTDLRERIERDAKIASENLRIRNALDESSTGVMIAEMYASRTGIGHLIANWGENFQMPQLFAGVILLATVAILFNEVIRYLEDRFSTWRT